MNYVCVYLQSVGSGLSLEPPATTEADEEEDGMSDIIQEVTLTLSLAMLLYQSSISYVKKAYCHFMSSLLSRSQD